MIRSLPESFVQFSASFAEVGSSGCAVTSFALLAAAWFMLEFAHSEFSASAFGDDTSTCEKTNENKT